MRERFGHEGCAETVLLCDRFDHIFEKRMTIRSNQCIGILPIHLELTIGILMIVLIRFPAQPSASIAS